MCQSNKKSVCVDTATVHSPYKHRSAQVMACLYLILSSPVIKSMQRTKTNEKTRHSLWDQILGKAVTEGGARDLLHHTT